MLTVWKTLLTDLKMGLDTHSEWCSHLCPHLGHPYNTEIREYTEINMKYIIIKAK